MNDLVYPAPSVRRNLCSIPKCEGMERWIHKCGPAGVGSVVNDIVLSFCSLIVYRASSSSLPAYRYACSLMREGDLRDLSSLFETCKYSTEYAMIQ